MRTLTAASDGVIATQHGMLLQTLAAPESGLGVQQVVIDLTEAFEPSAFIGALHAVVGRHDTLRTAFTRRQSGLSTWTVREAAPETAILDWQNRAAADIEREFNALLIEDRRRGFDPAVAPLLRCRCLVLPNRRSRILLTYHHLIMDGVARETILLELFDTYDARRTGGTPSRPRTRDGLRPDATPTAGPPPPETGLRDASLAFWKNALAGLEPESPLASLRCDSRPDSSAQTDLHCTLPAERLAALRSVATGLGCSLHVLVYACWALCLHRASQQTDIAFLTIRNSRSGSAARGDRQAGSLVNSVPLRLPVLPDATLGSTLASAARLWDATRPHAMTPLAEIKDAAGAAARQWDCNVLFHHDLLATHLARTAPPGERRDIRVRGYSDVPLTVAVMRGQGLGIHMQYWTGAFRPGTVESLLDSFAALLGGITADPTLRLRDLPYLGAGQRRRLDMAAAGPAVPAHTSLLLHQDLVQQAARTPDHVAYDGPDAVLSYAALDQSANALASALLADGLRPEEPVAVLIERSAAQLVAVLAVLKAGGAFVPLSGRQPDPTLRRILSDSGARLCLVDHAGLARVGGLGCRGWTVDAPRLAARQDMPPPATVRPDQLAYLIATSGTTGTPKLVEVEHRAAANTLRHSLSTVYAPSDLAVVPWFDAPGSDSAVHQMFAPLSSGGMLVPVDGLEALKASSHFSAFTTFGSTPAMLANQLATRNLPPGLRAVTFGGAAFPPGLPERLRETTGIRRATNVYGPTEAAIYCTADEVLEGAGDGTGGHATVGHVIGRPIANSRVELLDHALQPVMPGMIGEICVAGIGLARGYRGLPEQTARSFPMATGADGVTRRYYRTGDLAVLLPDGRLEFHGRRDRQVKISGVRVELDGIERAIEALPGVHQAVIAVRRDARDVPVLVGWVVARGCTTLSAAAIRAQLAASLSSQMVPRAVMVVDAIPLTEAGKPNMAALPMPEAIPEAGPVETMGGVAGTFAADPREALISEEWVQILGHDRFGRHNDFFEVGGDSLGGTELLLRLGEMLGCQLTAATLAGPWTIAALAQASHTAPPLDSFQHLGAGLPGPPVFFIVPRYRDASLLNDRALTRPVYLLGLEQVEIARDNFQSFAAAMVRRIRTIQPAGPYLVGGFCIGALAAFEVAKQLEASGAEVGGLAIVDRGAPSWRYRLSVRTYDMKRWLQECWSWGRGPVRHAPDARDARRSPSWAWRRTIASRFRPDARLRTKMTVIETRHSAWRLRRLAPDCGWAAWSEAGVDLQSLRLAGPEDGIQQAVCSLSMGAGRAASGSLTQRETQSSL